MKILFSFHGLTLWQLGPVSDFWVWVDDHLSNLVLFSCGIIIFYRLGSGGLPARWQIDTWWAQRKHLSGNRVSSPHCTSRSCKQYFLWGTINHTVRQNHVRSQIFRPIIRIAKFCLRPAIPGAVDECPGRVVGQNPRILAIVSRFWKSCLSQNAYCVLNKIRLIHFLLFQWLGMHLYIWKRGIKKYIFGYRFFSNYIGYKGTPTTRRKLTWRRPFSADSSADVNSTQVLFSAKSLLTKSIRCVFESIYIIIS